MQTTLEQFAASGPQMAAAVDQALIDAVNASALAIVTEARKAIRLAIGSDSRLGHMKGKPKVGVFYARARGNRPQIVAPIRASGPAQMIERPRKGGYTVKAKGRALAIPDMPRKSAKPGPIIIPLAPITKTFARANQIIEQTAPAAIDKSLGKGMEKALEIKVVTHA